MPSEALELAKAVVAAGERIYGKEAWEKSLAAFEAEGRNLSVFADVIGDRYSGAQVDQGKDPATLAEQAEAVAMQIGECF